MWETLGQSCAEKEKVLHSRIVIASSSGIKRHSSLAAYCYVELLQVLECNNRASLIYLALALFSSYIFLTSYNAFVLLLFLGDLFTCSSVNPPLHLPKSDTIAAFSVVVPHFLSPFLLPLLFLLF